MKGSADVATMKHRQLMVYAEVCGWTLAHAHARSGDGASIHGYLGSGDVLPRAIAAFALAYADQTEKDYEASTQAIVDGSIEAHEQQ